MFDLGYEEEQPTREEVDALTGVTLLVFGTNWCGYCRAAKRALDDAVAEYPEARVIKVEDAKGRPLGRSFQVKLWPTMIALRDGEELSRVVRPNRAAQIAAVLATAHEPASDAGRRETYILAGGCYWCLDAAYRALRGVEQVVSGFIGGDASDPSYELVCTGTTGHAEAVAVTFDPEVIPRDVILDAFFTMHDPRQLNRQGNDVGSQYRSAMFPQSAEQRALFEAARERADEAWGGGVVTTMEDASVFWPAPEYHQDFFAKNPTQGYCLAVAVPKVNKIRAGFSEYLVR